ncbi:MAG: macrocin-O-methyltransferase [Lachnospiraceae bacterium]|nr:macrocin-O-methyltransferase [Lachnospiraceae bacterium]
MLRAYLFGAGGGGARLYDSVKEQYDIVGIVDNDERKWGTMFRDHKIGVPEECLKQSVYDVIVLTSAPGRDSIIHQVRGYGIAENRIITSFVDQPLESRRIFLKSLSVLMRGYDRRVSVAEAGVFQGDFAKYMNQYFPDRKLYLFDTFEGFDEKDVALERQNNYSAAGAADYHNTSLELVRQKMEYPDQCIFKVGYFPETASGIEDEFCFVNLDLDLYQPTLEGLRWFESRMVQGGVILIHDFFADNFRGVRQAVDEYMRNRQRQELHLMPIGDGISIAICGF